MSKPSLLLNNDSNEPLAASTDWSFEKARVLTVQPGYLNAIGTVAKDTIVWVEAFDQSTCGDCKASGVCGQGVLNRWFQNKNRCIPIHSSDSQARLLLVGQWVDIAIPTTAIVKASLLMFGLPIITLIIGAAVADKALNSELAALAGSVAGFAAGLLFVRAAEANSWFGKTERPQLVLPSLI